MIVGDEILSDLQSLIFFQIVFFDIFSSELEFSVLLRASRLMLLLISYVSSVMSFFLHKDLTVRERS